MFAFVFALDFTINRIQVNIMAGISAVQLSNAFRQSNYM